MAPTSAEDLGLTAVFAAIGVFHGDVGEYGRHAPAARSGQVSVAGEPVGFVGGAGSTGAVGVDGEGLGLGDVVGVDGEGVGVGVGDGLVVGLVGATAATEMPTAAQSSEPLPPVRSRSAPTTAVPDAVGVIDHTDAEIRWP